MALPSLRTVLDKRSAPVSLPSFGYASSEPTGNECPGSYPAPAPPSTIQLTLNLTIPLTVNTAASPIEGNSSATAMVPVRTPPPLVMSTVHMTPHAGETTLPPSTGTGYRHVHRKPKAKRNRKGWGPYQSVTRERAVDFNLTLDVQNLKQEIQQLTTARDLLQSRMLQLRHSPTGSLMQMIREYYQLFRTGFRVEEHGRRRHVITAGVQRNYLHSVVDKDIDFGNGLVGVEFLVEMLRRYSHVMRFISMDLESFSIVTTDDDQGVVIHTKGPLRLQILRETIATIFPHILGNTWLCARLIGAEVVAAASVTFHFNANNRICTLVPDADYVAAFSQVLPDPADVLELLGQSKISEQSMLGVSNDGQIEELDPYAEPDAEVRPQHEMRAPVDGLPAVAKPSLNAPLTNQNNQNNQQRKELVTRKRTYDAAATMPARSRVPAVAVPRMPAAAYLDVVNRYVLAFADGWPTDTHASSAAPLTPRQFLHQFVSPYVVVGRAVGHVAIEHMWQALGAGFELLGFRATSEPQLYDDGVTVSVRLRAAYDVAVDMTTLQTVFPHVLRLPRLVQTLLGAELTCLSDLWFEWHGADTRVARVRERLDWDAALTPLLRDAYERAFVLDQARLSPEGYVA